MKVPNTKENYDKCICTNCPSYNDCTKEKNEKLFCAKGKSACDMNHNGCICGECPVQSENRFSGMYFCINGEVK